MSIQSRIQDLKIELPPPPPPGGVYRPVVLFGNVAHVSGHGPLMPNGTYITGRLGEDIDLAGGQAAARQVGLAILSTLQNCLGTLERVKRIVKSLAWVNSSSEFTEQPLVVNGYSELMRDIFGEDAGVGARSAIGTNVLPGNIPVEIEISIEVDV